MPNPDDTDYLRAETDTIILHPPESLMTLTGEDAISWLQGQVTNDLRQLSADEPVSFCICQPTGQLLSINTAFVWENILFVSSAQPEVLEQRAQKMVIMEDVSLVRRPERLTSVQGPQAAPTFVNISCRRDRTGRGGWDIWSAETFGEPVSENLAETLRLEAGLPMIGREAGERTLPLELGPAFEAKHISYTKGCYTGQEVLMRIHSRGHTNKTLVGLHLSEGSQEGDEVSLNGEVVGQIHSVCLSPKFGPIAMATVRNVAAEVGTVLECRSGPCTVESLPFMKGPHSGV